MSILSILEPASTTTAAADRRPARHRQHPRHGRRPTCWSRWPTAGSPTTRTSTTAPARRVWSRSAPASRRRCRRTRRCTAATGTRPGSPPSGTSGPAPRCTPSSAPAPDDQVIFTRQTTDALNLLAHAVPADATVIVFESEHHAALLPWPAERTVRLAAPGLPERGRDRRRRRSARRAGGSAAGRRHRRVQRHRRDLPDRRDRRGRQGARCAGLPRRRAARAAPAGRHRRAGRRLGRAVRPQALRAVRRRCADRPRRLARRRRPVPVRRRRHAPRSPATPWSGRPARPGTRAAPPTSSARSPSPRPVRRSASTATRSSSTSAACSPGSGPDSLSIAGVTTYSIFGAGRGPRRHRLLHGRRAELRRWCPRR